MVWLKIAPLLVIGERQGVTAGEQPGYAEFRERIVEKFDDATDITVVEKVCKACLLQPDSINVARWQGEALAAALDQGAVPKDFLPWGWGTRALLAYRSGNADLAVEYANKSEEYDPAVLAHAINLSVIAMAQHQRGDAESAKRALDELSQLVDRDESRLSNYHDLLIAHILFEEAKDKVSESVKR